MGKINKARITYLIIFLMLIGIYVILQNHTEYALSIFLFLLSVVIYIHYYLKNIDPFNPDGVFSFIWFFSISLSNLKLSVMQFDWDSKVWIIVLTSWTSYLLGSKIVELIMINKKSEMREYNENKINLSNLKSAITFLFLVSVSSFILEVIVAGYIPLFSRNMSAYGSFGISFVHYNTVAMTVVVLLSFYYILNFRYDKRILTIFLLGIAQIVFLVSRQLLIFTFFGGLVIYHYKKKAITLFRLLLSIVISISIFGAMGSLRDQSLDYLYNVAQIKPGIGKSFLMWPYLYISMGFENLRNLIMSDIDFTFGRLTLEPLWALTRIKTLFSNLNLAQYKTIPEFNVSTFLSDFYIDFGFLGIMIFPFLIGLLSKYIYIKIDRNDAYMFSYIFILHNLVFSFFVNFYSNTSIIINLSYFLLIYYYSLEKSRKIQHFRLRPLINK